MFSRRNESGFSIVELILAGSIFVTIAGGLFAALFYGEESAKTAGQRARATFVAEQGLEAVRAMRDADFDSLVDGTHGLAVVGSTWQFSGTEDVTDIFTRQVAVSTIAAGVKEIESTVTWQQTRQRTGTVTLTTRLTDWTVADAAPPVQQGCVDLQGGQDALKVDTQGNYAFMVTQSSSQSFESIDITDPNVPVELAGHPLQNNPLNLLVEGDYAYIASSNNSKELILVNISDPANLFEQGYENLAGNSDAWGIAKLGDDVFVTTDYSTGSVVAVDTANASNPNTNDTLDLNAGTPTEIYQSGSYVFIASDSDSQEVQIVDIDDPSNLTKAQTIDLPGNADALTIGGFSGHIAVGRSNGELVIIDTSIPLSPVIRGTYSAGASVNDVDFDSEGYFAFLATSKADEEFQIIDISDRTNPVLSQSLNTSDKLNGVSFNASQSRAYVVGDSNDEDFCSIEVTLPDPPTPIDVTEGMLVYADYSGAQDAVRYKLLNDDGTWSQELAVPDIPGSSSIRGIELYSSPTRPDEKILISNHSDPYVSGGEQTFYAQVWDGDSWEDFVSLGTKASDPTPDSREADGAYLANGDFILVFDDFTTTPKYRIWDGSSWSSAGSTANVGGIPVWITVRAAPNSDQAVVVVRDWYEDTNAIIWDGSSWGSSFQLGTNSSGVDYDNIDAVWSSHDNNVLAVMFNEWFDSQPNIRTWNSGSWSGDVENINVGGTARFMDIIDRPTAVEFLGCTQDSNYDINCLQSDDTPLWTQPINSEVASNTDNGAHRSFALTYETGGEEALIVYSNGTNSVQRRIPKWRIYDPATNAFTEEFELEELGSDGSSALESARTVPNPINDNVMVVMSTSDLDVHTVVWNGVDDTFFTVDDVPAYGQQEHGTDGSTQVDYWFDFEWDIFE